MIKEKELLIKLLNDLDGVADETGEMESASNLVSSLIKEQGYKPTREAEGGIITAVMFARRVRLDTIKEIIKFVESYYYKPNKELIQTEAVIMKCEELLKKEVKKK